MTCKIHFQFTVTQSNLLFRHSCTPFPLCLKHLSLNMSSQLLLSFYMYNDQHQFSPNHTNTYQARKLWELKGKIQWSLNKFSQLKFCKKMYGIRHKDLYVDIATYPNLPSSAEKCPVNNSPGMYVTVDSPVFAASVPLQIMRRSWSTLMSCDWRLPLGTDTLVSLTGTPITVLRVAMVLRNIPLWCEKEKTKTTCWILLLKRFFYILSYMHNFRPSSKVELFMYPA